jgi:quinol monooxygenase YgiN
VFARSTTVHANPASIDDGVEMVRAEVLPQVMQMDGCTGLSMMIDRDSGMCIVTTAWATADAMRASAAQVLPLRDRAAEVLGGEPPSVESWEIAMMHRERAAHEGACVRVGWLRVDPDRVDEMVEGFKHDALPRVEQLEGFVSGSLMVDRSTGRAVTSLCYESRDALDANRDEAQRIRDEGTAQMGVEVMDIREFELALAHLRVPEMA